MWGCLGRRYSQRTSLVLVTHGLALRVFLMRWFHWSVDQFMQVFNPPNAEVRARATGTSQLSDPATPGQTVPLTPSPPGVSHCSLVVVGPDGQTDDGAALPCSRWCWSACQSRRRAGLAGPRPGCTPRHCIVCLQSRGCCSRCARAHCAPAGGCGAGGRFPAASALYPALTPPATAAQADPGAAGLHGRDVRHVVHPAQQRAHLARVAGLLSAEVCWLAPLASCRPGGAPCDVHRRSAFE